MKIKYTCKPELIPKIGDWITIIGEDGKYSWTSINGSGRIRCYKVYKSTKDELKIYSEIGDKLSMNYKELNMQVIPKDTDGFEFME